MTNQEPYQPLIEECTADSKHKRLTLDEFLAMLEIEENYFRGEQNNTKLMITCLRKIFYDKYGWDTELIRGAAHIEGRYKITLVEVPYEAGAKTIGRKKRLQQAEGEVVVHKVRRAVYRKGDWMQPDKAGEIAPITVGDKKTVRLPNGSCCDIGHVLAGLDAFNYLAPVTPLPNFLMFLRRLFPSDDNNTDLATWLGDIASSSGEFLFKYLETKTPLTVEQQQVIINEYAPGADMLGDIDPYVIQSVYDISTSTGMRPTEILRNYYGNDKPGSTFRKHRFLYFANIVGLINWDGKNFSNEEKWLSYYKKQLRSNTAFYVYSRSGTFVRYFLALAIALGFYKKTLDFDALLNIFIAALKKEINFANGNL